MSKFAGIIWGNTRTKPVTWDDILDVKVVDNIYVTGIF